MRFALAALLLSFSTAPQDFGLTIDVVDKDSGKPMFARVVIKNAEGGVIGSTGYKTLNGHFVPPDGWKLTLPKGKYPFSADAGFEFGTASGEWIVGGPGDKETG